MTWASHPTTEMPSGPLPPVGKHRARRRGLIIAVVCGVALVVLAGAALLAPTLFSWPPPSTDPIAQPPSVPALSAAGTASPNISGASSAVPTLSPTTASTSGVTVGDSPALEARVIELTNAERASEGCAPLRLDDRLAAAARAHSVDMAATGQFGHPGSNGSDPAERMREAGYDTGLGWAENIARGQPSAVSVVSAWMGSQDHRDNILDCQLKAIGVGAARASNGQIYWTQDFGGV
jgi:uncharacterized protein YkwD